MDNADFGIYEQILKELMKMLTEKQVNEIFKNFQDDSDKLKRILEALDRLKESEKSEKTEETKATLSLKEKWLKEKAQHTYKFDELIKKYLMSYLSGERETEFEPSRAYIETLVSNHAKWYRMINHHGRGRQYQDDIRRVCFAFRLTFPEANELMWSAGQAFEISDYRDFIIMDCLQKGIYSYETVDEILLREGQEPLFPDN